LTLSLSLSLSDLGEISDEEFDDYRACASSLFDEIFRLFPLEYFALVLAHCQSFAQLGDSWQAIEVVRVCCSNSSISH